MEFQIDVGRAIHFHDLTGLVFFSILVSGDSLFICLLLSSCSDLSQVGLALTLVIVFGYYSVSVFGSLIGQVNCSYNLNFCSQKMAQNYCSVFSQTIFSSR